MSSASPQRHNSNNNNNNTSNNNNNNNSNNNNKTIEDNGNRANTNNTNDTSNMNTMQMHQIRLQQEQLQIQQQQLQTFWATQIHDIQQINPATQDFKIHQLPLARIKKIMKTDEDVRMISAEAPVVFAKACELFILELSLRAWNHTEENKRRTLQRNDIAVAITKSDMFDFLIDIVPREEIKPQQTVNIGGTPSSKKGMMEGNTLMNEAQAAYQQQFQQQQAAMIQQLMNTQAWHPQQLQQIAQQYQQHLQQFMSQNNNINPNQVINPNQNKLIHTASISKQQQQQQQQQQHHHLQQQQKHQQHLHPHSHPHQQITSGTNNNTISNETNKNIKNTTTGDDQPSIEV